MKFEIDRTSLPRFSNKQPCKNAYKENGFWYIDIETLEELLNLSKGIDEELIVSSEGANDEPYIEIYDDYRE